jgi:3-hydroxyisobutyrate dehydrogenase-like beta-hydroxyacid dehydrogenase
MTAESPRPAVGFIGFGDQELPMATAVADAGYELHAWARRPGSLDALGETPFVGHDELPRVAAASDVLAVCVSTDDDVIGRLRSGLLDGLRRGAVFVNHGTGTPGNARRIAEMCEAVGIVALDAPVSGGRPAAERHTLTTRGRSSCGRLAGCSRDGDVASCML